MRTHSVARCGMLWLTLVTALSCSREPRLSDETWREAVSAFHTSLAAMQTSQDVLARGELERLIELVPQEPAAWANLGLLLLRQQQTDEGSQRLAKAAELAPGNAAIERLVALAESQKGNLEQSIRHWRRAIELDPGDLKAPFALAREIERQGGDDQEAEAQRILESLVARSGNLAARIEYARLAAKRGDAAALRNALDGLKRDAASWSPDQQERLRAAEEAAARSAADAATPIIFLKNVLLPTAEYRIAIAAVATPQSEVGEPLVRLLAMENPDPRPAAADDALTFSVESAPAVTLNGTGWAGAAWLDGTGNPVVVAASGRELRVGTGATLPFPGGPSAAPPAANGVLAADLNYDFRLDLVLAGAGGLKIFIQDEKGGFSDATSAAKVPASIAGAPLHGVWAADFDTDGDLDVVVAPENGGASVLRNNGDGTFAVRTPFAGMAGVRGFAWADLDGEGVPDAAIMDADGSVRIFLNLRSAEFSERQTPEEFPRVAAIAAADIDADGIFDVLGLTAAGAVVRLSHRADGSWDTAQIAQTDQASDLSPGAARLLIGDVDNNAAIDLIVAGQNASRILLGGPGGSFHPMAGPLALRALDAADLNGDGRLELVGPASTGARVARSQGRMSYHWQAIRPRAASATGDQRVNSFGIGGEAEIRTGLHAQKHLIASPVVHFGLGDATQVDVARITWPNGFLQSEFDLAADSSIAASQRLKGSCPWLFAWNGREMGFVTDLIWRSPLGLRINAQATADVLMTEDWVKIRGDQLAAREGAYDLRITAELWETHFYDLVSLLVVDHPVGTEVFVDERFAVPSPLLGVVATSAVQEFRSVRDDGGREVGEIARARDDRHLDFAGRGVYQGVTREHYVELELPQEAPRTGPLWLVAQGWVHPTDSSVNVALSQGAHAPPAGLSLHVADARGRFSQVRADLGFPAGKDKTILVDLSGLFPASGPRRVRLKTNLEIFWDRLGWAVGRPDVRPEPYRIDMASALLRYRGYSVTAQKDASTPERPRYVLEGTAPRWRDLEGFHTRFGDVRELLLKVDDRYVIMNAGDELLLRFPEAPPPAPGMTRDYVLVGDGWIKDGDYNTTASQTVLPLPTHRSAQYNTRPGRLADDPVYRRHPEDFQRYHTRFVSAAAVRDALRVRIDPDDR